MALLKTFVDETVLRGGGGIIRPLADEVDDEDQDGDERWGASTVRGGGGKSDDEAVSIFVTVPLSARIRSRRVVFNWVTELIWIWS